jgi:ATP adenylyltransferase
MEESVNIASEARFEWVLAGKRQGPSFCFDIDLLDDDVAAIVPTKGSLVPGWLLVIPRVRTLSIRNLSQDHRKAVLRSAEKLKPLISDFGERIFMLEHGPCIEGLSIGCGVDQAHLHVVPLNFDLVNLCQNVEGMAWQAINIDDPWRDIELNRNYYLIVDGKNAYVSYPEKQHSQFFRRKIAQGLGVAERWDYKLYPCEDNALITVEHCVSRKRLQKVA